MKALYDNEGLKIFNEMGIRTIEKDRCAKIENEIFWDDEEINDDDKNYLSEANKLKEEITDIAFDDSISEIDVGAFKNCNNITKMIVPEGVKSIYLNAFSNCKNLKELKLPDSLDFMETFNFANCPSLKSVIYKNQNIEPIIFAYNNERMRNELYLGERDWNMLVIANYMIQNNIALTHENIAQEVKNRDMEIKKELFNQLTENEMDFIKENVNSNIIENKYPESLVEELSNINEELSSKLESLLYNIKYPGKEMREMEEELEF